ncbi:hypothetical protein UPYG_G00193590 [Umbra pygmaea]|uniref:Phospholipase A1 member A n=1 Tax=Umbra pygmaea TaxID=75934 RepID=A0ABD0WGM8_UMBPY
MPISPTVIIVPGRRPASHQPSWVRRMAWELLQEGPVNILVADWLLPPEQGITEGAREVGVSLAQVIQTLLDQGLSPELFHLIGFGVGAHVSGMAGARLKGTIGRITGLDPFSPEFSEADSRLSLDHTDARYVDVIHTNFYPNEPVAALGISRPLGHVDFYVGKGYLLPGCPQSLMKRERYLLCSHQWAYRLFTSSIRSPCPLTAIPCPGLEDYQRAACTGCQHPGVNGCPKLVPSLILPFQQLRNSLDRSVDGYDIRWLPPDRPINFQQLTAVLDITSTAPFCVTPFMMEVELAGNMSLEARVFIQVTGEVRKTPVMLVSGPSLVQLDPHQTYQFMVSIDYRLREFRSMSLEFNSQRLLYFPWRKRSVQISRLALIQLPRHQGMVVYNSWAVTAVENQRVEMQLWKLSTTEG